MTALGTGIIAAIVIGSVIGFVVCVVLPIVLICCLCCKKKTASPGMVLPPGQGQPVYGTPMYYPSQPWQSYPYPPPPPPPPPASTYPTQENPPKY